MRESLKKHFFDFEAKYNGK
jgi:hypothetical protein